MFDRRSKTTCSIAVMLRLPLADVVESAKTCVANWVNDGRKLAIVFQNCSISAVLFSRWSNLRYRNTSSFLHDVNGLSTYLAR